MSNVAGNPNDAKKYRDQASSYISKWASLAGSSGHLAFTYGEASSFGLMYNLYADKLMGTGLVPSDVYANQTRFLASQAQSAPAFGLPFDSHANNVVKSHWTMFAAGTMMDSATRDTLVSQVHAKVLDQKNTEVFPSTYDAQVGTTINGSASAAVGGLYSLLALTLQPKTITIEGGVASGSSQSGGSKSNAGAIAGAVVAVLIVAILAAVGFFLWRRRARRGLQGVRSIRNGADKVGGFDTEGGHVLPEQLHHGGGEMMGEYKSNTNGSNVNLMNGGASVYSFGNTSEGGYQSSYYPPQQGGGREASIPRAPSSQTSSRTRGLPSGPRSLRLHNGDLEDGQSITSPVSTYSNSNLTATTFRTPQAPPLPSKQPITLTVDSDTGYGEGSQIARTKGSISSHRTLSRSNTVRTQEGTRELRDEVELLRREMAEMRSRTDYEPPPEYQ
ncbi:hypothetical protein VKT23_017807 [Stygiomarasmius scandens]|uniref:Glutaminase A central domain-containing protein n=1 Tax=Marasmiellus scandens TaxID=2682957 RepID=A0ABR1IQZ4_9AGAR